MTPDEIVSRAIARSAHAQRIELSIQQTIDRLWERAQIIGLDDGDEYLTLRNAIAWLEVMRNG
jgi:hypothetical protein